MENEEIIKLMVQEETTEAEVDEWLFREAAWIAEHLEPGTPQHSDACDAWVKRYNAWIMHNKELGEEEILCAKYKHEKDLEITRGLFAIGSAIGGALVSAGFYMAWTKIMQIWEDRGHVPVGTALKSMARNVKPPKV